MGTGSTGVLRARQRLFLRPLAAQDWDGRLCPGAALLSGGPEPHCPLPVLITATKGGIDVSHHLKLLLGGGFRSSVTVKAGSSVKLFRLGNLTLSSRFCILSAGSLGPVLSQNAALWHLSGFSEDKRS